MTTESKQLLGEIPVNPLWVDNQITAIVSLSEMFRVDPAILETKVQGQTLREIREAKQKNTFHLVASKENWMTFFHVLRNEIEKIVIARRSASV